MLWSHNLTIQPYPVWTEPCATLETTHVKRKESEIIQKCASEMRLTLLQWFPVAGGGYAGGLWKERNTCIKPVQLHIGLHKTFNGNI